jgi:HEAT repeat protein
VDSLLTRALSADPDAKVRLEAAFAFGFRGTTPESFAVQKKFLLSDPDEKVRGALISNLAKMEKEFPEVRGIVQSVAQKDASEYVRKTAASLLAVMPAEAPPP